MKQIYEDAERKKATFMDHTTSPGYLGEFSLNLLEIAESNPSPNSHKFHRDFPA